MSALHRRIANFAPIASSLAIASLLSAAVLIAPMTAARAASPTIQTAEAAPGRAATHAFGTKAETVEQRIANLHAKLKITPDEEAKWNDVAQAMRENAAALEKLNAERTTQAPQGMTAVDDLKGYEKFAQAHADGLKNLIASFQTLYDSLPDAQKKNADQVFQSFGQKGRAGHR